MQTRAASAVMIALYLAGCAATTPPPRFSAVSPADTDGPEAATPPPAPALAGEPEAQAVVPPGAPPKPAGGHEGHSMPAEPAATRGNEPYTCPMHPEVKQASPGSCPKCGMQLVQRKGERLQR